MDESQNVYCAVREESGKARLMMVRMEKIENDQFARFELKGDEVLAYHANGALLARLRLRETPPARYSCAPEQVRLRFTGPADGAILCEAENLTDYPVLLRNGNVRILITEGNNVRFNNLLVKMRELTLNPREKRPLQLPIMAKKRINPTSLGKHGSVELVCYMNDPQRITRPGAIAPVAIMQPGLPDVSGGFLTRLRDDLAVEQQSDIAGSAGYTLAFYRLRNGIWEHATSLRVNSRYNPFAYEVDGNLIRVLDFDNDKIVEVTLP